MQKNSESKRPLFRRPLFWWAVGWLAGIFAAVFCIYYWRVFYSYDRLSAAGLTVLAVCAVSVVWAAAFCAVRFVHTFAGRAALGLAVAGLFFCFADPPLQAPDESDHFLRAYAVSLGRFDFDADRGYPADVDLLLDCFPGAYANANDGAAIKQYYHLSDAEDPDSTKIADGPVLSIADCFADYRAGLAELRAGGTTGAKQRTEPLVVMVLPYLPQALGMLAARVFGASALGCLYAGRVFNLAVYVLLAWLALRGLERWRGVFCAVLFLPLSLYMAGSLSYDALLLGLYALAASLLLREPFTDRRLAAFLGAVLLMNVAKPWINLLWLFGLLFVPRENWRARRRPWAVLGVSAAAAFAVIAACTLYGRVFRSNYGEVGRMLGEAVSTAGQLSFVLHNPLRTLAVLWGTLYENAFFLPGLGSFGALDVQVPAVVFVSVLLLAGGAFADSRCRPLSARLNAGLGIFAVVYGVSVLMALYLTYTPVGMVRVIGLQARYFMPPVLAALVLAAEGLGLPARRALPAGAQPVRRAPYGLLAAGCGVSLFGALWLFEAYFIGPVTWALSEL